MYAGEEGCKIKFLVIIISDGCGSTKHSTSMLMSEYVIHRLTKVRSISFANKHISKFQLEIIDNNHFNIL